MTELPVVTVTEEKEARIKKPDWLRVKLPIGESYKHVRSLVDTITSCTRYVKAETALIWGNVGAPEQQHL